MSLKEKREHDKQQLYPTLRKAQQSSAKQEPFTNISTICIKNEIKVEKLTFKIIKTFQFYLHI